MSAQGLNLQDRFVQGSSRQDMSRQDMSRQGMCLRAEGGNELVADTTRWLAAPPAEECRLLELAAGPVLDVGCGPGRHVLALARRGVMAMGLDITPAAVRLARTRGAAVLQRSVFSHVPGEGRWGTALLLDGNIGIGGDPAMLLARLAALLSPLGRVLVEIDAPVGDRPKPEMRIPGLARLELDGRPGPWFGWMRVDLAQLALAVASAGMTMADEWVDNGRHFAHLTR